MIEIKQKSGNIANNWKYFMKIIFYFLFSVLLIIIWWILIDFWPINNTYFWFFFISLWVFFGISLVTIILSNTIVQSGVNYLIPYLIWIITFILLFLLAK